jgi:hypothetical protein
MASLFADPAVHVLHAVRRTQDEQHRRSKRSGAKFNPAAKRELADFNSRFHQTRWDVTFVGTAEDAAAAAEGGRRDADAYGARLNTAMAVINEDSNLQFEGESVRPGGGSGAQDVTP